MSSNPYREERWLSRFYGLGCTDVQVSVILNCSELEAREQRQAFGIEVTPNDGEVVYLPDFIICLLVEGQGMDEFGINARFGVPIKDVRSVMLRNGYASYRRDASMVTAPDISKEELQRLFRDERYTLNEAANMFGVYPGAVRSLAVKYGVKTTQPKLSEEQIIRYWNEGFSIEQIAAFTPGISASNPRAIERASRYIRSVTSKLKPTEGIRLGFSKKLERKKEEEGNDNNSK